MIVIDFFFLNFFGLPAQWMEKEEVPKYCAHSQGHTRQFKHQKQDLREGKGAEAKGILCGLESWLVRGVKDFRDHSYSSYYTRGNRGSNHWLQAVQQASCRAWGLPGSPSS